MSDAPEKLRAIYAGIEPLLDEIAGLFAGDARITLLVRHPALEAQGKDADFVMTSDTLSDAIVALQRRADAGRPS